VIKIASLRKLITNITGNLVRMLGIAWQMDRFITFGYFASSGVGALFPILASYLFKIFLDELISSKGIAVSIPLILVTLLASRYFVNIVWDFVSWGLKNIYFDFLFRSKIQNALNFLFYKKVSKLDIAHLEDTKTQDLIAKASDTFTWRSPDLLRHFSYMFNNFVSYVSSFIILIPFGLVTPFFVTLVTLPRFFLRAKYGRLQWSIYGAGTPDVRKLWYFRRILSDKTSVIESRIFQSRRVLLRRFKKIQNHLFEMNKKPVVEFLRILAFPQLLEGGVIFFFAYLKLPDVLSGKISIGDFTFFISLLDRITTSAGDMILNFGDLYDDNLYVNHYFEVLNLPKLVKKPKNPKEIDIDKPISFEFRNVSFKYPGTENFVLKDINFSIEPKDNIAIVGANGAGKTTIVKLLCRFYDVTSGEILVNGVNIKDLDLDNWYRCIGTLFQEFMHYDFTVRENIMLGNPKVKNEDKMRLAANQSGVSEFVEALPNKYNQLLGRQFEGGVELSQGQWQKLAIARAFYEGAQILILDEPTSAIDAESEYEIFQNLNKHYKDKTLFLISHRFSTVRNANKIIVLKEGRILETGSHDELLRVGGLYARMFRKQALGYQ